MCLLFIVVMATAIVRKKEGETQRSDIVVDETSVKPMPDEDPQKVRFSMVEFILTLYYM